MPSYKISKVRVKVKPGVTLTADVSSAADVKQLLKDLEEEGFASPIETPRRKGIAVAKAEPQHPGDESPLARIETRAALAPSKLVSAKILAFKDSNPQLLRPSDFESVSDATLSLLYAVEIGAKRPSIPFDDFRDLYDAQNIKSGSPLPVLLTNLRNAGYIDKKAYATDRTIRLTAKGETKAAEVFRDLCGAQDKEGNA